MNAADADDVELVERHRRGDPSAFEQLVVRYQGPLIALANRYVRNSADAADVAQRCFLAAVERIDQFRGEAPFRTWLFRILVNLAISHIRREKVELVPLEDDAAFTSGLGTNTLMAKAFWSKIEARLVDLPAKQRLVIELRVFHDLSFAEVAALAGCSEESARANYHHAVKHLRDLLPAPASE